jgi:peptidoglycan/LPS O-acetylase OafA/YrhL
VMPLLLGVEPFFVLGGFLAALSFQYSFANSGHQLKVADAKKYIKRRWVRTLPNYFLFLAIYTVAFFVIKKDFVFDFSYLVFAQNLFWLAPNFFSISWSLATQEWFYVLLPILMLVSFKLFSMRLKASPIVIAAAIMIVISFIFRLFYIVNFAPGSLEGELRRIAALRLDSVAIGVLVGFGYLSGVKFFTTNLLRLFVVGTISIVICNYLRRWDVFSESYIVQLSYYPLYSLLIGFCVPYLYELPKVTSRFFLWLFERTSKWSYSIYLSHVLFLDVIYIVANRLGVPLVGGATAPVIAILWVFMTYFTSAFLYKYFEMPCVKWLGGKK